MFKIYGKQYCPACEKAKKFLELNGKSYKYLELGKDYDLDDLHFLAPDANSVPQVFFVNDNGEHEYIGGLNQLTKYLLG